MLQGKGGRQAQQARSAESQLTHEQENLEHTGEGAERGVWAWIPQEAKPKARRRACQEGGEAGERVGSRPREAGQRPGRAGDSQG